MTNISTTTGSPNKSYSTTVEIFSKAQVIAWSCVFATEAVMIVVGNSLTIGLFAFNKKLRNKKSLYLVLNMAFADVLLGGVCLPICVYSLVAQIQWFPGLAGSPIFTFFATLVTLFSQASFLTALFISAERFYAVYWPLKHRTLSALAYRFVIFTAWTLAILVSIVYFLPFFNVHVLYAFGCLYGACLVLTVCGLNMGIWRTVQLKAPSHQQNRTMQNQRLTKALSVVSIVTLSSWIPTFVSHLIMIFGHNVSANISTDFLLLAIFTLSSSSFINPVMYALRIPDFQLALRPFCFRRQKVINNEGNTKKGRVYLVANHNHGQLACQEKFVTDTKL